MKYRRLDKAELDILETEFVDFLVLNGIIADDWQKMKKTDNDGAEEMIALFSEVVFEGIMRKTKYIDFIDSKTIMSFSCASDKLYFMQLKLTKTSKLDLMKTLPNELIAKSTEFKVSYAEKSYKGKREHEIFEMISNGCEISDGNWFRRLSAAFAENNDEVDKKNQ